MGSGNTLTRMGSRPREAEERAAISKKRKGGGAKKSWTKKNGRVQQRGAKTPDGKPEVGPESEGTG